MEAIIFVGIQASGKSSFYKQHFFNSHLRISNDQIKTKYRERKLLELCVETNMPLVIDNTNPTRDVRAPYIALLRAARFTVKCYYFKVDLARALRWNQERSGGEVVPQIGLLGTHKRLEIPHPSEGFDLMYYVDIVDGQFLVKEWNHEI